MKQSGIPRYGLKRKPACGRGGGDGAGIRPRESRLQRKAGPRSEAEGERPEKEGPPSPGMGNDDPDG